MAVREIVMWPSPLLRLKSVPANLKDISSGMLDWLVDDMLETMRDAGGIGLSAIQLGFPTRLFVMDVNSELVLFNPTIVTTGTPEMKNEGCLSLPGILEQVRRYPSATVTWYDRAGGPHSATFKGLEAQCAQHEYEHLEGLTIPDHLTTPERESLVERLKAAKEKAK